MTQDLTLTRTINLEVAFNVRHLGGYRAANGRRTPATIIRSAGLHRLTGGGSRQVADLGVRTIIDLRSEVERERDVTPDLAPLGIRTVWAPVFQSDASPSGLGKDFPGFGKVYERFLDDGQAAWRTTAETIGAAPGAVIVHCSAGKDRTGVAAALLLDLAGVERDEIVADFAESAGNLAPERDRWLPAMEKRGISAALTEQLLASDPEDMEYLLDRLHRRWGGAAGYLRSTGLESSTIEKLQQKLVD